MQLDFTLTRPQTELVNSNYKFNAFVAGMGSGKSETSAVRAIYDALEGGKDARIEIYAPTHKDLAEISMPRIKQKLEQCGIEFTINKTDKKIYPHHPQMGYFSFRYCSDPNNIYGFESFRAHVDEFDTLPTKIAKEVWLRVLQRNRQQPATYRPLFKGRPCNTACVYTTPEGFKYTYQRWVEQKDPKNEYKLINASTISNPFVPDDYISNLISSHPPELIEAYLMGKFVNLTSGTVYYGFDRRLNHCNYTIDEHSDDGYLHIGMDFNIRKCAAVVHIIKDGLPYAVDEITDMYDSYAMRDELESRYPGRRLIVYPDASGKTALRNANDSDHNIILSANNVYDIDVDLSNPAIVDRVNAMNGMFHNQKGQRRYKINTLRCPWYTKCLEQQTYDAKTGKPYKDDIVDHMNDAGGYFMVRKYPIERHSFGEIIFGV